MSKRQLKKYVSFFQSIFLWPHLNLHIIAAALDISKNSLSIWRKNLISWKKVCNLMGFKSKIVYSRVASKLQLSNINYLYLLLAC